MSRELRMVPKTWIHPTDDRGNLVPLYGRSFKKSVEEWDENEKQWKLGFYRFADEEWKPKKPDFPESFSDWDGDRPKEEDYMPDWEDSERTHFQMYETCTEGTPISPVMDTPEELARWLADSGASAFGNMTATYEEWIATIKRGWACGMVITPEHGIQSGVAALAEKDIT